eukprot:TRINITY_DN83200_c0_g1_i1.p1 TRINITY_DN83200_c0_g1~~TRINITY_DN83200_c0_g1_i1.p1  ORF type:complete len:620 (+),score=142.54 TRINITY_DN83200_c0_g1_i1:36-1862(+)
MAMAAALQMAALPGAGSPVKEAHAVGQAGQVFRREARRLAAAGSRHLLPPARGATNSLATAAAASVVVAGVRCARRRAGRRCTTRRCSRAEEGAAAVAVVELNAGQHDAPAATPACDEEAAPAGALLDESFDGSYGDNDDYAYGDADDDEDDDASSSAGHVEGCQRTQSPTSWGSWRAVFEGQGQDIESIAGRIEKAQKKTLALVIGYNGRRYAGLQQVNCNDHGFVKTVESELELALYKAGAMLPSNFGNLKRVSWSRAGRTDAGVNAAVNVIAGRFLVDEDGVEALVKRVNEHLPPDIVLHGAPVVAKRFNARFDGSSRSYIYYMPTYCLGETSMRDVYAAFGEQAEVWRSLDRLKLEGADWLEEAAGLKGFRASPEQLERFRAALAVFPGTHFYGNFAKGTFEDRDPVGFRHVVACDAGEPFLDDHGREWITVTIAADSFLTHQIRKMLATAAQVAQGVLPLDFIRAALDWRIRCNTPRMPPYGLVFLRPVFKCSSRGYDFEEQMDGLEREGGMNEWLRGLRADVISGDEKACHWVWWLACCGVYNYTEENAETVKDIQRVVAAYRRGIASRLARIQVRKASAVQHSSLIAAEGIPLWQGRHSWD